MLVSANDIQVCKQQFSVLFPCSITNLVMVFEIFYNNVIDQLQRLNDGGWSSGSIDSGISRLVVNEW